MATSQLRLSVAEFYDMPPRTLFAMLTEWLKIEKLKAYLVRGGQIDDEDDDEVVEVEVHPDAW